MKLVAALIRPEQLPPIKAALYDADLRHMTVTAVMGTAPEREQQMFRGVRREVDLQRRLKVELVLLDSLVERAIEAISKGAMESGGAGRIYVSDVETAVKIWTGERGSHAL